MASLNYKYDLSLHPNQSNLKVGFESYSGGATNITVDWGDDEVETVNSHGILTHTYTISKIYNVIITCNNVTDYIDLYGGVTHDGHKCVTECTQFPTNLKHLRFQFCENLVSVPTILPSSFTSCEAMFSGCTIFNTNIGTWNTTNITNMKQMFQSATAFNQDIGGWVTKSVTNMIGMFQGASTFNQNISGWVTNSVTNMREMFYGASAFNNGDVGDNGLNPLIWTTNVLTDMSQMFYGATVFNQNLNSFNTNLVSSMEYTFRSTNKFNNGDVGNNGLNPLTWTTNTLTNMYGMFNFASAFNQDVSSFNTDNVTDMQYLFYNDRVFNNVDVSNNALKPLSWVTNNVTQMNHMFSYATSFNQNISDWDISKVTTMEDMFHNAKTIQRSYYDAMLTQWSLLPVQSNVQFHAGTTTQYTCGSVAETARNTELIANNGWIITDGGCFTALPNNIYADITFGVPSGLGTAISPFNKSDLDSYLEFNVENLDTIYIRGQLSLEPTDPLLFPKAFRNISTPVSVTFKGWDIANNASPIIIWTYNEEFNFERSDQNTWWNGDNTIIPINVTFQDMIIKSNSYFMAHSISGTYTFKDVLFIANDYNLRIYNISGTHKYFGCTINATNISINAVDELLLSDCVITTENIEISNVTKLSTFNSISNIDDFVSYINNVDDLSEYTPVLYVSEIISTPVIFDFDTFVKYYTNPNRMYYKLYNIPRSNNIWVNTYRIDNGYNNGLFNDLRDSYGAYGFIGTVPDDEIFPTSGVIGSFYFGGDYTNVDISGNTLSVTFEPVSTAISIDMNNLLTDISTITLNVINRSDYVTAQDTLFVDFVAKRRNSETYPKFCKCDDSICTMGDKAIYDKAIIGGDPIIVDFSACTNAVGTHTDYKPIEYHWYFDYGNYPNDYEITTEPYATHTYCGGYLEAFDVKLCVQFA